MIQQIFRYLFVVLAFLLVSHGVLTLPVAAAPATSAQRFITIDFDNVDIRVFVKYISELTGKNFVIDKAVQGNVTIISPTKISEEEAFRVFQSVLEVHGYTTVTAGSITKIIPSAEARSQNIQTIRARSTHPEDRIVTQLIPLKYSSPEEMKKVLTPLVSKSSVVMAHTPSGMLIVTETLANIQRLLAIIEAIDVEFFKEEIAVIPLVHATSEAVAKVLGSIYQQVPAQKKEAVSATTSVKVVPYERINALVVVAEPVDIERMRKLVALLDTEVPRGEGNIHVFYLQNATAPELVKVLNALPETQNASGKEEAGAKAPSVSKNAKFMADAETNSIIVTASREEYAVIEEVIKKLDIPRRMVYLEALILEVDTSKSFDVGVEWVTGGKFADSTGQAISGFTADSLSNIRGITGDDPFVDSAAAGFTLGVLKQGIKIGGITFPNIAAILRAYKNDSDIDIISTPQILTTDNKKAEISVGENIPYITRQDTTSAVTDGSGRDYTQYEYKDVSTKMTITPHINQADTLRLEIQTEMIKLKGNDTSDFRPTTYKRTANTTVLLNDKDTVVIGGIIGHDSTKAVSGVPLLSDIPLLGALFRSEARSDNKTNMFIFITPHIIRNPADLSDISLRKEKEVGREVPDLRKNEVLVVDPQRAKSLVATGYDLLLKNNYSRAREFFQKALEAEPQNPFALLNLGAIYEHEGNLGAALAMYQAVISTGTALTAPSASDPSKVGVPLIQLARENMEKLQAAATASGNSSRNNQAEQK